MSNVTWVCFECRTTVRRPSYGKEAVLCSSCGKTCRDVGYKLRLPPKRQTKQWRELLVAIQQEARANTEEKLLTRLRWIRALQSEIACLEAKSPNEGRAKQIRLLRQKLAKL